MKSTRFMKYRDEDMLIERCHKLSDCPCATSLLRPCTIDKEDYLARGEQGREGTSSTNDKSAVSACFYCLSRTVRAGAADGPRPEEFRRSVLLIGLSNSWCCGRSAVHGRTVRGLILSFPMSVHFLILNFKSELVLINGHFDQSKSQYACIFILCNWVMQIFALNYLEQFRMKNASIISNKKHKEHM